MHNKIHKPFAAKSVRGFTLIELLVVILIIGISLTWVTLKTSGVIENYRLRHSAEKAAAALNLTRQQAVLQSTVLGIKIINQHLQLYRFIPNDINNPSTGNWQLEPQQGSIANVELPKTARITLNPTSLPITFYPNGQISAFQLELTDTRKKISYQVQGEMNGKIKVSSN